DCARAGRATDPIAAAAARPVPMRKNSRRSKLSVISSHSNTRRIRRTSSIWINRIGVTPQSNAPDRARLCSSCSCANAGQRRSSQGPFMPRPLTTIAAIVVLVLAVERRAGATNLDVHIAEFMAGANGDSRIQFIVLAQEASGQNLWGPQPGETQSRAMLVFFDV